MIQHHDSEGKLVTNADKFEKVDATQEQAKMEEVLDSAEAAPQIAEAEETIASGGNYKFLVRGAKLRCSCGSHSRCLNLPKSHSVYFNGFPLVFESDCEVGDDENIRSFGVCSSEDHPKKADGLFAGWQERLSGNTIMLKSEEGDNIRGLPCSPYIVGGWQLPREFTNMSNNSADTPADAAGSFTPAEKTYTYKKVLDTHSFLVCLYGGIITPGTDGQEYQDPTLPPDVMESEEAKAIQAACELLDQKGSELSEEELEKLKNELIENLLAMKFYEIDGKWGSKKHLKAYEKGFEMARSQALAALLVTLKNETDPYAVMSFSRTGLFLKTGEIPFNLANEYRVGISLESTAALEARDKKIEFVGGFIPGAGPPLQILYDLAEEDYDGIIDTIINEGIAHGIEHSKLPDRNKLLHSRIWKGWVAAKDAQALLETSSSTDMDIRISYRALLPGRSRDEDLHTYSAPNERYCGECYRVTAENEVTHLETIKNGAFSEGKVPSIDMNIFIDDVTGGNQEMHFTQPEEEADDLS